MNGSVSLPSLWGSLSESGNYVWRDKCFLSLSICTALCLHDFFQVTSRLYFFLFSAVLSSASNPPLCVSYWWIAALPEVSLSSHWPRGLGGCIPDWSPAPPLLPDPVWWSASTLAGAPLEKMSIVVKKWLHAAEDYVLCKGNVRVPYIILDILLDRNISIGEDQVSFFCDYTLKHKYEYSIPFCPWIQHTGLEIFSLMHLSQHW